MVNEWEKTVMGNSVWNVEDRSYALSYNDSPFLNLDCQPETAIIDYTTGEEHPRYYILYGDWREVLVQAAKRAGLSGCKEVFQRNKECHGFWTSELPVGGEKPEGGGGE